MLSERFVKIEDGVGLEMSVVLMPLAGRAYSGACGFVESLKAAGDTL